MRSSCSHTFSSSKCRFWWNTLGTCWGSERDFEYQNCQALPHSPGVALGGSWYIVTPLNILKFLRIQSLKSICITLSSIEVTEYLNSLVIFLYVLWVSPVAGSNPVAPISQRQVPPPVFFKVFGLTHLLESDMCQEWDQSWMINFVSLSNISAILTVEANYPNTNVASLLFSFLFLIFLFPWLKLEIKYFGLNHWERISMSILGTRIHNRSRGLCKHICQKR